MIPQGGRSYDSDGVGGYELVDFFTGCRCEQGHQGGGAEEEDVGELRGMAMEGDWLPPATREPSPAATVRAAS